MNDAESRPLAGDHTELSRSHVHQKVDDTVGVAPLVVVPRDDLEETLLTRQVVLKRSLCIVNGGVHIVNKVLRHKLLVCEGENALHVCFRCLLEESVDLFDRGVPM